MVADQGTFQEWFTDLETENPLEYPGYEEKDCRSAGEDKTS